MPKTRLLIAGAVMAIATGCQPKAACDNDSQCQANATCQQGLCVQGCASASDCGDGKICRGGSCATIDPGDLVFTIKVKAAAARICSTQAMALSVADQCDPKADYSTAFHRDESAQVIVSSPNSDVDWKSISVAIRDGAGNTTQFPASRSDNNSDCEYSVKTCATVSIPLYDRRLKMHGFRATFQASATGKNLSGAQASTVQPARIKVTRWKWKFSDDNAGEISAAPVIDSQGNVYFIAGNRVYKMSPSGQFSDRTPATPNDGRQQSINNFTSMVVGKVVGKETVLIAGYTETNSNSPVTSQAKIWGLGVDETGPANEIAVNNDRIWQTRINASIGFIAECSTLIAAVDSYNDAGGPTSYQVLALDLSSSPANPSIFPVPVSAGPKSGVAIMRSNDSTSWNIFVSSSSGLIGHFTYSGSPGFPRSITQPSINPWYRMNNSVAASNPIISKFPDIDEELFWLAAGSGDNLFLLTLSGASWYDENAAIRKVPLDSQNRSYGEVSDPIESWGRVVAGTKLGNLEIVSPIDDVLHNAVIRADQYGAINCAPVAGQDGLLYVSTSSQVYAIDDQSAVHWTADSDARGGNASPALDCLRAADNTVIYSADQQPVGGLLYVGDASGNLYSLIVDSPGLNTKSTWPRFHRDQRNSADASAALSACPSAVP